MQMHHSHSGNGEPLVLIHGLGGSRRSWDPIVHPLADRRTVVAVDLPGFGETPPLPGEVTIPALADALESFLSEHGLRDADIVGSSMGARLVLELARRGHAGATVALSPGGFWTDVQKKVFQASIAASVRLVRLIEPALPTLTGSAAGRTLLLAQLSARPWALPQHTALTELRSLAAAPSVDKALKGLVDGPGQMGLQAGAERAPITIGWGRQDRVCLPSQSKRAIELFPSARLHWFDSCGHFPHWDAPAETVDLILRRTGPDAVDRPGEHASKAPVAN